MWPLLLQAGLALAGNELDRKKSAFANNRAIDESHARQIGAIENARDARLGRGQYGYTGGGSPDLQRADPGPAIGALGKSLIDALNRQSTDSPTEQPTTADPIGASGMHRSTEDDLDEALAGLDGYLARRA